MAEQVVGASPVVAETSKAKGVYTLGSIIFGSILGGAFVVGWLMGENYKALGKPELATRAKVTGAVVFILLMIAVSFVNQKNLHLGTIVDGLAIVVFARLQKKDVEEYLKNGGIKRGRWPLICILYVLLAIGVTILGIITSLPK
jgi:hypothetical protein